MKVGVQTVHCSKNPGASLQAFALCKKISEYVDDVEVINYCPLYFLDPMDPIKRKHSSVKERVKNILIGRHQQRRYELFKKFNADYLPKLSRRYNSNEEMAKAQMDYDVYICGSDQIWNPEHISYDNSFFFDYVNSEKSSITSYAASIGQDVLNKKDKQWLKKGIQRFDHISIREPVSEALLSEVFETKKVNHNIDPTLLYPGKFWKSIENKPDADLYKEYILYYPIQNTEFSLDMVKTLKEKTGLPCIALDGGLKKNKHANKQIREYGPAEFLWLIHHASYVVTNSFHGTVFSLMFNKKVVVYKHLSRNSRLDNLLTLFDLKEIQIESLDEINALVWDEITRKETLIEQILVDERKKTNAYIQSILYVR